jgi:hypothetical protein
MAGKTVRGAGTGTRPRTAFYGDTAREAATGLRRYAIAQRKAAREGDWKMQDCWRAMMLGSGNRLLALGEEGLTELRRLSRS